MAGRLTNPFGAATSPRRRAGLLLLVLAVAAIHGCVTQSIVERMADVSADRTLPPRMDVAYVREMELTAPPVAAPAAALPAAPPRAVRARAAKPSKPASAPDQDLAQSVLPRPAEPPAPPSPAVPVPAPPATSAPGSTVVAAAAPASAAASSALAPYEWPSSTRLSYELTGNYRGEVNGSAQVEWIRSGTHYQVHLDLIVGPSGAPLISRRMSSDGEITEQGLSPRRYDQDTKVLFRDRSRVTVTFEPDAVTLANGDRRDSVAGMQDSASQFVQLTWLFTTRPDLLAAGSSVDIPLALPNKVDVWTYDVVEEETLNTPFGLVATVRLKPRKPPTKPGDLTAEIWFAPQLRYLPVRIRIQQDPGTYVDLMISRRPEIAGP